MAPEPPYCTTLNLSISSSIGKMNFASVMDAKSIEMNSNKELTADDEDLSTDNMIVWPYILKKP